MSLWLMIMGGIMGYVAIAAFVEGLLRPLTKWSGDADIAFSIFWPISWIFLASYPGRWVGKKIRGWFDERSAEEEKKENLRLQEENRQRIEIENIEKELEEEERLRRNESYYEGK